MNEHTLCCGTVADKAKLCAEIEKRDLRIKNLELCEDARARVAGRTLKFAMERGYNPARDENELEYIMRRFDEIADADKEQQSVIRAQQRRIGELLQERDEALVYAELVRPCIQEAINALDAVNEADFPGDLHAFKTLLNGTISQSPKAASDILKQEWNCPTVENGKNRYGLDVAYFRNLFNRELNRTLQNYRPDELARNLLRMARTADKSIIAEAEFTGEIHAQWQAEGAIAAWVELKRMGMAQAGSKNVIQSLVKTIRQRTQEPK